MKSKALNRHHLRKAEDLKKAKGKNLLFSIVAFALSIVTLVQIFLTKDQEHTVLFIGVFAIMLFMSIQFAKNIFTFTYLNEHLENANTQLKSLDELKSEFISLASHQLRSPLTVIKGYASTLTDGIVGEMNEKQTEIVHRIYTSAQGLAFLVEDFLNVTKIEQGGMHYVLKPTDLRPIVEDIVRDMESVANNKELKISFSAQKNQNYVVDADALKIKQVFLNIVDNSIKYTKEGYVKVSLTKNTDEDTVTFSVTDSGVGISEATRKKLFTKFGRGEEGRLNSGGSGLGLYLAAQIVKAHKGEILATSEGKNKGATFSIVLASKG